MYNVSLILVVILFLILVILTIELTISTDTLNRLPSNIYTDTLDPAILDQTFSVLILIFLVGAISLGVLIYYKSTLVNNPTTISPSDNSFISASRVDAFVYGFTFIIILGLLISIFFTFRSLGDINTFLSSFESVVTTEDANFVKSSRSNTRVALILEGVSLLFSIFILIGYAGGF